MLKASANIFLSAIFLAVHLSTSAQIFDYSYHTTTDSTDLKPIFIEETSGGEWIACGDRYLFKMNQDGALIWAKEIQCGLLKCLRVDGNDNIFYLHQDEDTSGYLHSFIVKLDPNGNPIWNNKIGDDSSEVEVNDLYVKGSEGIFAVGRMNYGAEWFNVVMKIQFSGALDWAIRLFHPDAQYSTLIKLDRAPGGKFYTLGQWDHKTIIYKFQADAGFNDFKQFISDDSLIPVDIVARTDNDIQVLMNRYDFVDHFGLRTLVKMQCDQYLSVITAKEYSKGVEELKGVDLEIYQNRCFIVANKTGSNKSTLIERTEINGDHNLTRDIRDQMEDQVGLDLELRDNFSMVYTYAFGTDSTHIVSATNPHMQSDCNYDYSTVNVNNLTISSATAAWLNASIAYPIITTTTSTNIVVNGLDHVDYCFGNAETEQINEFYVKIYPNPVADYIFLEAEVEIADVKLYDIQGREVIVSLQNERVDLSSLGPGTYSLMIFLETGEVLRRTLVKL